MMNRVDPKRIVAKKRFGQNFLKDAAVISQIIESMPNDNQAIVEIGPGLGDLTSFLVETKDVTAYEVDQDLCSHLRHRFLRAIEEQRLILKCGDVLDYWEKGSLQEVPYRIVANLPYYIATAIVLKALKDPYCQEIIVMVQKEVAEKFAAQSKQKAFGALSVLAQSAGEVSILFDVPPEAFMPSPKVVSSVLSIQKKRTLFDRGFEAFLKVAFAQPRKRLAKNLAAQYDRVAIASAMKACDLTALVRPHEVMTSLYHRLYTILRQKGAMDGREEDRREEE